jgi:putative hydrolase of HD superfamily
MIDQQDNDLAKLIDFLKKVRKFQTTYRFTPKPDGGFENDAEHSWAMGITAIVVATRLERELGQKVDLLKVLKMIIVHDLPEIDAGDTKTWDAQARVGKEDRERHAMTQLLGLLPSDMQNELMDLWEEFEKGESLEAKIVKSIDRIDPVLHRTFTGVGWANVADDGAHSTPQALDERQLPRHNFSKLLTSLYEQVRDEAINDKMFPDIKS